MKINERNGHVLVAYVPSVQRERCIVTQSIGDVSTSVVNSVTSDSLTLTLTQSQVHCVLIVNKYQVLDYIDNNTLLLSYSKSRSSKTIGG